MVPVGVRTRAECLRRMSPGALRYRLDQGDWQILVPGLYWTLAQPPPLWVRAWAAWSRAPAGTVISHTTAAALLGLPLPPLHQPAPARTEIVHLTGPEHRSPGGAVRLHRGCCPPEQQIALPGGAVTSPARTAADFLLGEDRRSAIALTDAVLRSGTASGAIGAALQGRPRAPRARSWLALADARAESYLESAVRLLLQDAGLAPEQLQYRVWDGARVVARLDLAYPRCGLGIEADGRSVHRAPEALYGDRLRQNRLVELGWAILRFTWRDVQDRPDDLVRSVAHALPGGQIGQRGAVP